LTPPLRRILSDFCKAVWARSRMMAQRRWCKQFQDKYNRFDTIVIGHCRQADKSHVNTALICWRAIRTCVCTIITNNQQRAYFNTNIRACYYLFSVCTNVPWSSKVRSQAPKVLNETYSAYWSCYMLYRPDVATDVQPIQHDKWHNRGTFIDKYLIKFTSV